MLQVFRLMDRPDRVIAFENLPDRLLDGIEMVQADGFPRHWKEWMGKSEKKTKIPPERDPISGQVRTFPAITESNYYFYIVDGMIQPIVEKWKAICDYVAENKQDGIVLRDNIADMAMPLANDQLSPLTLEPEEVRVIKLKAEGKIEGPVKIEGVNNEAVVKCEEADCKFEAVGPYAKNAVRMHKNKKHPKPVAA